MSPLVVPEGGQAPLTRAHLDATGLRRALAAGGHRGANVLFVVDDVPQHGWLEVWNAKIL